MNKQLVLIALLSAALVGSAVFLTLHKTQTANPSVEAQWKAWKREYNMRFGSEQDAFRMDVFAENLATINADTTGTLGMTQFMAMTQEEFEETYLTLKVENAVEAENVAPTGNAINWETQGKVTPVKNQGKCGSCWAFSATGAIESLQLLNGAPESIDLSEQQLIDCSSNTKYNNHGCNGGLMDNAFKYVIANKITSESDYPYKAVDEACNNTEAKTATTTIAGFKDVKGTTALLAALQTQPISIAVDASNWSLYKSGNVFSNCGTKLNHGVLLVGYDGANWIVKNSWGTAWGNQGYITLKGGNTCGLANAASYPTL